MITFFTALALLVFGYILYGAFVEKVFGANAEKKTPAYELSDGVDYIPMPTWKVYLIQFLNIAGTGPIFGAILGVLFGPAAYLWIVIGCIFGGATHDYLAGMISLRKNGASLPEVVGDELGSTGRMAMRILSLLLMIMVGAVFVTTPSGLLNEMFPLSVSDFSIWPVIIFCYYILATLLPVDTLIGRLYPLFGCALIFMAIGVMFGVVSQPGSLPEINQAFHNYEPHNLPLFPMLFITIACGAVSGFHATQSPMMARCLKNEKLGRPVFYGAMITEGLVALIWAAAAMKFADMLTFENVVETNGSLFVNFQDKLYCLDTPYQRLNAFLAMNGNQPSAVVKAICQDWLGTMGAILAVLGVVAAPITSGDTALRAARLIAADFLNYPQKTIKNRFIVAIPLFAASALLMCLDFSILWRYFAWMNQTLSIFTFWTITVWLYKKGKPYIITLIPAMWMTCVCTTYILISPKEGVAALFPGNESWTVCSYVIGVVVPVVCLLVFLKKKDKFKEIVG